MNSSDFEKKLSSVISRLIRYEDGDVMLAGDLMGEVEGLSGAFPSESPLQKIFGAILFDLKKLLDTSEYATVQSQLTEGLDLLSKITVEAIKENLELQGLTDSWLEDRVGQSLSAFIANYSGLQNPVITDESDEQHEDGELAVASDAFKIFLTEATERIVQAQELVMELEDNPNNEQAVNVLFRVFHTIKGECGFLKITGLGELAHNLENFLSLIRDGTMKIDSSIVDILLAGIDYAKEMILALKNGDIAIYSHVNVSGFFNRINLQIRKAKSNLGDILIEEGKLTENDVEDILTRQKDLSYSKKFGEIAVEEHLISKEDLETSLANQKQKDISEKDAKAVDSIIKVKSSQINYLVDMVGELLIIEAQLDEKAQNLTQLKKITREIQYASMQLRTEKVKNLFIEMKRAVRDTARQLQKKITVVLKGEELEIDRDLVETLQEPLMHMVRNSVSHGIEDANNRLSAGKPGEGTVKIEAERRGNWIVIGVEDDGKGLCRSKIISKAIEKKIVSEDEAKRLSDHELYQFIFLPGFSTSDSVNLVSGRGVGMDIVRTAAEAARGHVDLSTEEGRFTRIEMVFPLSTAIIDGMIVKSRDTTFIIPVANIIESLKVDKQIVRTVQGGLSVIVLRDEIIPVIRLKNYFEQADSYSINGRDLAVIVQNNKKRKFALFLDEIITKREVFIKSLGSRFNNLKGISSGTILQGGRIGFVLDIETVCRDNDPGSNSVLLPILERE